MPLPTSSVY